MAHDEIWRRNLYGRNSEIGIGVDDDERVCLDQWEFHRLLIQAGYRRIQ